MSEAVLVTGGAGFIGSHIVDALLGRGYAVRVLDDLSTGRRENLAHCSERIEFIEGDVRDAGTVDRALAGVAGVFHEAARPSVALSFEQPALVDAVNVGGTVNVLEAARRHGARRLVMASSCAVYGASEAVPLAEDARPAPLSPYAVGKLACEGYCGVLGAGDGAGGSVAGAGSGDALETVCLRYFNVYGPRQDPSSQYSGAIARFLTSVAEGRSLEVFGDGRQTRDFVYVGDVVAANLLALTRPGRAGTVINVGSGRETSVLDLVEAALGLAGRPLAVTHGAARAGDVRRSSASLHRAAELLGYAPAVGLSDGLRRTYEWYARTSAAGGPSTANGDGQPA